MSPTILVVEDNPVTRKMLRFSLESEGYGVIEAGDGTSALNAASRKLPDLVVQDYVLPDMDGLRLLDRIRGLPGGANVPALVVTGMVSRLEELRARAGGATSVLAKPVEPSRLIGIVRTHLSAAPGTPGKGRRILLVDDDPLNLELATVRLRAAGFLVETASGGEEALAKARLSPPDAVLSDVLMPGMDGFQLCYAIRQDPRLSRVPVLLFSSAYRDEEDRRLADKLGAHALLVSTPELKDVIEALVDSLASERPAPTLQPSENVLVLHEQRVFAQLERQMARNEGLLREGAIQAAALSVIRGLTEVLARPADVSSILGDILIHCLDAAGLSTGILYVIAPEGDLRLQAQSGLPTALRADAEACFGRPELLARVLQSGEPAAWASDADDEDARALVSLLQLSFVLAVPFVVLGERHGVLVLASDGQDLREPTWLGFAHTLAAQFGQTIALGHSLARLAASEARYRSLMEHANDAILLIDADSRRILEANRSAETLLGLPREHVAGRRYLDLVPPDEREDASRNRARLLSEGSARVAERHLLRPDGTRVPVEGSDAVVHTEDGPIVVSIFRDITERKRAERALLASERRLRESQVIAQIGSWEWDIIADEVFWSEELYRIFGIQPSQRHLTHAQFIERVHPNDREHVEAEIAKGNRKPGPAEYEYRIVRPDGTVRNLRTIGEAQLDSAGRPVRRFGVAQDITDRKRLEDQLRQAQKMEAVGNLAGGVAHDFNNLLSVIIGYGDLLARDLGPGHRGQRRLEEIKMAAERGAGLTRQLLAFSRKQILQPKVLDLGDVVSGIVKMLRRLIGENVEISTILAPELGRIRADPGQVEQVIMNLAVNARDAMPGGGKLILQTANVELDEHYARSHAGVEPGRYVALTVSDTGHGMDAETRSHIFEPFFTTKEEGKGTGLGLATVYGIVQQSGGHVSVYSEPGIGTSFRVFLPRVNEEGESRDAESPQDPPRGTETVLLVEDAEALRMMTRELLEGAGYSVIVAARPDDAIQAAGSHEGRIDLVLTDVVMPGMSGAELARRIQESRPQIRVLYMSGYTNEAIGQLGVLEPGVHFLQKPFTVEALLRKLREVLDAPKGGPQGT